MPNRTPTRYNNVRHQIRSTLIRTLAHIVTAFLCLLAVSAVAGDVEPFPGRPIDSRTMHVQQKVEQLFDSGDYRRARFIYENELAPLGDKYAQYMIGYIHLTGAGVQEDPALAAAWYRLAAERGNPQFVAIRDQLLESMTEFDRGRANALFLELRRKYSDAAIVLSLIKDDLTSMTARTGSRISKSTGPVTIIDPRSGRALSSDYFDRQIARRAEARVRFLVKKLGIRNFDINVNRLDIEDLEKHVADYLASMPN